MSEEASRIMKFLKENPKYMELLKLGLAHEDLNKDDPNYKGWAWNDVKAYPPVILAKLVGEGIIKINHKSRRYTNYLLCDRETVRKAIKKFRKGGNGKNIQERQ
jgi:hypothetical protein